MPFTAGLDLCCPTAACVLLDTAAGSETETWDLIPHVTLIGITETVNTPKLVTSSSAGAEISACGQIARSGNLAIACHSGVEPNILCANAIHRIRWALFCNNIWDADGNVALSDNDAAYYFEAVIRITSFPFILDIAGNQPVVTNYGFDILRWITIPACQTPQNT